MKNLLKTLGLAVATISFVYSADALATRRTITTTGENPACFERPNTAVISAIKDAESQAKEQCSNPILVDLKVSIRRAGGCSPVEVSATYSCNN